MHERLVDPESRELLSRAVRLLSHVMLVDQILSSNAPAEEWPKLCGKTLEHIEKEYKLDVKMIDATLYEKITKPKATESRKAKNDSLSQASTDAPSSSACVVLGGSTKAVENQPSAKKFKAFGRDKKQ